MTRRALPVREDIRKSAEISACGCYRTRLTRHWDPASMPLTFWMLNPSTADADIDDPTIRRCIGFARREGYGGIVVGNAYALRSTDPSVLYTTPDAFGEGNRNALMQMALTAAATKSPIVCGWGAHAIDEDVWFTLADIVKSSGAETVCLGKTKHGLPRHPLYVRGDQPFEPFYFMRYPFERRDV